MPRSGSGRLNYVFPVNDTDYLQVVTRQSNLMLKAFVCDINIFHPFETRNLIKPEQLYQPVFFVIDQSTIHCTTTLPDLYPARPFGTL